MFHLKLRTGKGQQYIASWCFKIAITPLCLNTVPVGGGDVFVTVVDGSQLRSFYFFAEKMQFMFTCKLNCYHIMFINLIFQKINRNFGWNDSKKHRESDYKYGWLPYLISKISTVNFSGVAQVKFAEIPQCRKLTFLTITQQTAKCCWQKEELLPHLNSPVVHILI